MIRPSQQNLLRPGKICHFRFTLAIFTCLVCSAEEEAVQAGGRGVGRSSPGRWRSHRGRGCPPRTSWRWTGRTCCPGGGHWTGWGTVRVTRGPRAGTRRPPALRRPERVLPAPCGHLASLPPPVSLLLLHLPPLILPRLLPLSLLPLPSGLLLTLLLPLVSFSHFKTHTTLPFSASSLPRAHPARKKYIGGVNSGENDTLRWRWAVLSV